MIFIHRNPLPSDSNIYATARLLAPGSTGGLRPSRQDFSRQWLNNSQQPPSPVTAAGPPRFCTVFHFAEAILNVINSMQTSPLDRVATTLSLSLYKEIPDVSTRHLGIPGYFNYLISPEYHLPSSFCTCSKRNSLSRKSDKQASTTSGS